MGSTIRRLLHLLQSLLQSVFCLHWLQSTTGKLSKWTLLPPFSTPYFKKKCIWSYPKVTQYPMVTLSSGQRLICQLRKCLYRLKQAPRAWYSDIDAYLSSIGFTHSEEDYNLYVSKYIILLLFVDDIPLFSPKTEAIRSVKGLLQMKYQMTDLGPVQQFLGIQVVQDWQAQTIHINQAPYIESVLRHFQMDNCNGISTPMDPNAQLEAAPPGYVASKEHMLEYQQAVGSIMYMMLGTRPDLAFMVSTLSKYCSNPTPEHSIAVQRALRYLWKTSKIGITYNGQQNPAVTEVIDGPISTGITGFTDSDWAGDKDTQKSTSGYIFLLRSEEHTSELQSL